jgi:hypothetical protein
VIVSLGDISTVSGIVTAPIVGVVSDINWSWYRISMAVFPTAASPTMTTFPREGLDIETTF